MIFGFLGITAYTTTLETFHEAHYQRRSGAHRHRCHDSSVCRVRQPSECDDIDDGPNIVGGQGTGSCEVPQTRRAL